MSDFLAILQFSWIPLAGAACYALIAAPLGSLLSLRDEILLGLALPPVGAAGIVLAVTLGIDTEAALPLYAAAFASILLVSMLLPGSEQHGASARWRAVLLAGIFCAGEAATLIMGAASARVEAHVQHMLRGEVLAMEQAELFGFIALTLGTLALAFRFRGLLYALALDQEGLIIRNGHQGRRTVLLFRVSGALIIAAGVISVGPLLTLGLLAIPTLLWERSAIGLGSLITGVIIIGLLGTISGFLLSITVDMPPVPVVIAALFLAAGAATLTHRRRR
jgi:ABC-type Mn2+/Zn2+ transport system permease subunit